MDRVGTYVQNLYLLAVDTAQREGFHEDAHDFGGHVAELALAGGAVERPMIDLLREYLFEKRKRARERTEIKIKVLKYCGMTSTEQDEPGRKMRISREKVIQLARDGAGFDGIAKTFGIPHVAVGKLLEAAKEPKEWLEITI